MIHLSENDLNQLKQLGISHEKVLKQIDTFKEGIPMVTLAKEALVGAGISKFTATEADALAKYYNANNKDFRLQKFIPASGAASRMFKALFSFLEVFDPQKEDLQNYLERTGNQEVDTFFKNLKRLPFYDLVMDRIAENTRTEAEQCWLFVKEMLSENGLNYGFYPKGLLPFHKYGTYTATAFEEHLKEGAKYALTNNTASLHFTISEQHKAMFEDKYAEIEKRLVSETGADFQISYSFQKASTDTIAVTEENEPFRNRDGSLLFRPGGHGALIENLNEQQADIIFIKNIDNVVVPEYLEEISISKQVLGGLLLKVQQKAFYYANLLDTDSIDGNQLMELRSFLENQLNVQFSDKFSTYSLGQQLDIYKDKINRPLRICGMVKNEGEPGGGPFWIRDRHDHISLQIIESAQVDMADAQQQAIFSKSTHFNPVDIVCGIKNHKGEKYNLLNFVDDKQGFITAKTKDGKNLKALELPGLWNGAMAFWNTIFVEVPLITFNPVKTVIDLLKPSHQIT